MEISDISEVIEGNNNEEYEASGERGWLYGTAMVPATFGLFMRLAGLPNWDTHLEALTKLLSDNVINNSHSLLNVKIDSKTQELAVRRFATHC